MRDFNCSITQATNKINSLLQDEIITTHMGLLFNSHNIHESFI